MNTQQQEMTKRPEAQLEHVKNERRVTPPVDIYENQDELLVIVDIPGVEPDGLSIQLDGGQLDIEARQSNAFEVPLVFARSFKVPATIDAAKVAAEHQLGVLRVHLPKSELAKPRKIPVKGH
jgi:HSP20 family protein